MAPRLSQKNREHIIKLRLNGCRVTDICRQTGITRKTVHLWLQRWEESGTLEVHHRQVYERSTTEEQDAAIVAAHAANPFLTTKATSITYNISMDTVRRRLKDAEKKRAATKILKNQAYKTTRPKANRSKGTKKVGGSVKTTVKSLSLEYGINSDIKVEEKAPSKESAHYSFTQEVVIKREPSDTPEEVQSNDSKDWQYDVPIVNVNTEPTDLLPVKNSRVYGHQGPSLVKKSTLDNCNKPEDNFRVKEEYETTTSNTSKENTFKIDDTKNPITVKIEESVDIQNTNPCDNNDSPMTKTPKEKPYGCDKCQKCFTIYGDLVRRKRTHTGERPYKCDICHLAFTQKGALNVHMRFHTGLKPHECDICHRSFTETGSLKKHIRTHTGEKPYKRAIRQRGFTIPGSLKKHIKTVHNGENLYKCDVCYRTFDGTIALNNHVCIHFGKNSYQCDICQSDFTGISPLRRHMAIHVSEKPFKCGKCHRSFTRKYGLSLHMRTFHDNGKSFKCNKCKYVCTERSALKKHVCKINKKDKTPTMT